MNAVSAPAQLVGEPPLSSARTSIQGLSRPRPRPGRLALRLLQLQYWYDRLSEPQRLLVGVAVIVFLVTTWLYVLGLGSWVLVNRMDELGLEPATSSDQIVVTQLPEVVVSDQPAPAMPTAAVEVSDGLIQPPDVPEVPIIPAPPRAVVPAVPVKPRVMATVVSTPAPVVTAGPTSAATRTTLQATPVATPARPGTPLNGAGATTNGAATPVRTQAPAATATPARVGPTATLPRAPAPTPTRR